MRDLALAVLMCLPALLFASAPASLLLVFPVVMVLFSRIRPEEVLDNYTRGQIHGYIAANPGERQSTIREALGLNTGTAVYHLQRLESERLIKSATDGPSRRYYPAGMNVPGPEPDRPSEVQRLVLSAITGAPGISQRGLGSLLDLSPATVNYHVERLEARGLLRRERAGMRYRLFVNLFTPDLRPEPADALQTAPGNG